ncbi:MAG TPA: hypothetical protein VFT66_06810 [Roseiflexaceae bacterium]|nr:hypothetical protein [Roseiflexaceae bacterium]
MSAVHSVSITADAVPPLVFGIYPGSATGVDAGSGVLYGPEDDPARINAALTLLQPAGRPFMVRGYMQYVGSQTISNATPADVSQYIAEGRQLELVLCYRTPHGDLDDWVACVRSVVRQYGAVLSALQVTEEPNNPDASAGGDGGFPHVQQAIVLGMRAAKDEMQRQGYRFQLGFNATPSFTNDFWTQLAALSDDAFVANLDYVGFDFFPDVFRPLPVVPDGTPMSLETAVLGVLTGFRTVNLAAANIPATVPIRITENGWPTNPERSCARQAEVLETIVRTVYAHRAELNITHYEYFNLRDTDSNDPGFQFGLLRDDYTPKPAFECYRQLIAELG